MAASTSPRARQRQSIHSAYRARGHRNNNLWLVYSVKTNRDWLLPSDRQLIHWVGLESDPSVATFELAPEIIYSFDAQENRGTELDAIVHYVNGRIEWQEVKAGEPMNNPAYRSQLQAQSAEAQRQGAHYRIFSDADLQPQAALAVRWLYAIGFAAQLRNHVCRPTMLALQASILKRGAGTIADVVSDLSLHDDMVVIGLLVRLCLQNAIRLDLSGHGLSLNTRWARHG